jgi:hypothetical protein
MMAGIAAAITGGDASAINLAAAAGGNAAANNYLNHTENKARLAAADLCAEGDEEACKQRDTLVAMDKRRDEELKQACQGNPNSADCKVETDRMRSYLATYFPPQKDGVVVKEVAMDDKLSKWQQEAGLGEYTAKAELQSYIELLRVSNQQYPSDANSAKLPNAYNSDPYGVMDPKNPHLYMVVKVGDQWGVVGESKSVYTSVAGVNGILNETGYAPGLMGFHVNYETPKADLYTLYYNPTEGFWSDGLETFSDKFGITTDVTKQFSKVLENVQQDGRQVNWVAHSQGGAIFSEAVNFSGKELSWNGVVFHSGANNEWRTNQIFDKANINERVEGQTTKYWNSPADLVPNILGLNTLNPFKIYSSILAAPLVILGSPMQSPHTLPEGWRTQGRISQGGAP